LLQQGIRLAENVVLNDPSLSIEDLIVSTAYTCAWFIKQAKKRKPFVVCSHDGITDELELLGITDYVSTSSKSASPKNKFLQSADDKNVIAALLAEAPDVDIVVAGWDQEFSALKIAVAAMYLRLDPMMQLVSCSMAVSAPLGMTGPGFFPDRDLADRRIYGVGTGVLAKSILGGGGRSEDEAINVGKPSALMLDHLRKPKEEGGYGIDLSRAVMVGDSVETDVAFAVRGGMKSLLVFSGQTSRKDYENLPPTERHATWTADTFADM